jgi:hypothetical protein
MTLPDPNYVPELIGSATPRVAPPRPLKHRGEEFTKQAQEIGIDPYPWQSVAGEYLNAIGPDGRWNYPEVAVIVARQNGKSEILVPHIVQRLRMGRRIMHTAQDRTLPRKVFVRVAGIMQTKYRKELLRNPRLANGQEEIETVNGGSYRIVAPTHNGARGPSNDDLIVDEIREQYDYEFMQAAEPTLLASSNPQTLVLSNAGSEESIVLNDYKARAGRDDALAYLEWSAAPNRAADDREGWAEANPSIGHNPSVLPFLTRTYSTYRLSAGKMPIFETEHLCRWVASMREQLIDGFSWAACQGELDKMRNPVAAVSMSPDGSRADVAVAWQTGEAVSVRLLFHVTGKPIDVDTLGEDVKQMLQRMGVRRSAYDSMTDRALAAYLPGAKPMIGGEFSNACSRFVQMVTNRTLKWSDADAVSDDLTWTARKSDGEAGHYHAVRSSDERPITAVLAAIRAVWLASGPRPPSPRVM